MGLDGRIRGYHVDIETGLVQSAGQGVHVGCKVGGDAWRASSSQSPVNFSHPDVLTFYATFETRLAIFRQEEGSSPYQSSINLCITTSLDSVSIPICTAFSETILNTTF